MVTRTEAEAYIGQVVALSIRVVVDGKYVESSAAGLVKTVEDEYVVIQPIGLPRTGPPVQDGDRATRLGIKDEEQRLLLIEVDSIIIPDGFAGVEWEL
jgi:hypothetical protein